VQIKMSVILQNLINKLDCWFKNNNKKMPGHYIITPIGKAVSPQCLKDCQDLSESFVSTLKQLQNLIHKLEELADISKKVATTKKDVLIGGSSASIVGNLIFK
jgi:hypothetical protein